MSKEQEQVLSRPHLMNYMGWSREAVDLLPRGPEGWPMSLVLKTERTKAFRELHPKPLCVSETGLKKDFCFTDGILSRFGIEPDHLAVNPHHRSGPKIKLHRLGKIALLRSREDIASAIDEVAEKRQARSSAAKAQHAARANAWIEAFLGIAAKTRLFEGVTLQHIDEIIQNRHRFTPGEFSDVAPEHIRRWRVNILRHEFTNYDVVLITSMPPGRTGRDCYKVLKNQVLDDIASNFPVLLDECERQKWEMRERASQNERYLAGPEC